MSPSQRQRIENKRRQAKRQQTIIWSIVSVVILGVVAFVVFQSPGEDDHTHAVSFPKEGVGTLVPPVSADHVPDGSPVESPSDPPSSGTHYATPMPAGFYETNSPEYLNPTHDGYLIHSLEHGYVIFWYNCDLLDEQSCTTLKADIQEVMDEFNGIKLIAFPRPSLSVPLVMTSWGHLQEFETFDHDLASAFVEVNQPLAPEPEGV